MCYLPFLDNKFEGILSIASLHHLSNDNRRLLSLCEIYRILKPNGRCLLSFWSKNQPSKTKRKFDKFGDNYVSWNKNNETYFRFYYIFKIEELKDLILKSG